MVSILLVALGVAFGLSLIAALVALVVFPWFRSGERKPGVFRPDQSTGGMPAIVVAGRRRRRAQPRSSELPLLGGVAIVIATLAATIGVGVWLNFDDEQWILLGILLTALVGFGLVGFLDDWHKVYHGQGISERAKFVGVLVVSLAAAIALNRLVPSARFAYPPYADVPVLGNLLRNTHYIWVIFFILMTVCVSSTTSLAVDFTDGLDGLAGGLLVSAALSFGIIILSLHGDQNWPAALLLIAMVGALLGYLPLNWPSSFKAHGEGRGKRRAKLIMGDTGSLALGGTLALVTVITRFELLLIIIGGVFLLEGISALVSARILVKFFRKFLYLPRFGTQQYAHTEFPLPFLATPMHHHYDLLGWDRQRLVYGAWTLGAGLAALGVASTIAPFTWERYLARLVALIVIIAVWQMGPWSRYYFIGQQPDGRLALYYGFPYRLFGRQLYARVDTVTVSDAAIQTPAERLALWQRTSVYDARGMLGYLCFRAGKLDDAIRVWSKIPSRNLEVRPQIRDLLAEARHQRALEADGFVDAEGSPLLARSPVDTQPSTPDRAPGGAPAGMEPQPPAFPAPAYESGPYSGGPAVAFPFLSPSQPLGAERERETPPAPTGTPLGNDAPVWGWAEERMEAASDAPARSEPEAAPPTVTADSGAHDAEQRAAPPAWPAPDPEPPATLLENPWSGQAPTGLRAARLEPVNPAAGAGAGPSNALTPPIWTGGTWNGASLNGSSGMNGGGLGAADASDADGQEDAPHNPGSPIHW